MRPLSPNQRRAAVGALWLGLAPLATGLGYVLAGVVVDLVPAGPDPSGTNALGRIDDALVGWAMATELFYTAGFAAALRWGLGVGWAALQPLGAVLALTLLVGVLGVASGDVGTGLLLGLGGPLVGWLGVGGVGLVAVGGEKPRR